MMPLSRPSLISALSGVALAAGLAIASPVPPAAAQAEAAAAEPAPTEAVSRAASGALRPGDQIQVHFVEVGAGIAPPYRLAGGDELRIVIAGSTEVISETATVMPDGTVAVDPVGLMDARGMTVGELGERFAAAFSQLGMRQPRVTVSVVRPNGEVRTFLESLERSQDGSSVRARVYHDVPLDLPGIDPFPVPQTLAALRRSIIDAYGERFGAALQVSLNFFDRPAPVVFVTGDVRSPGPQPWSSDLTPLRAIAEAGGFTGTANVAAVAVIDADGGGEDGGSRSRLIDFTGLFTGQAPSNPAPLEANDVIVVPTTPTFR